MPAPSYKSPTPVQYLLHHVIPVVRERFRRYWFQCAFAGILSFAFFQKEFRVQVAWDEASPAVALTEAGPALSTGSPEIPPMNVSLLQPRRVEAAPPTAPVKEAEPAEEVSEVVAPVSEAEKTERQEAYIKRYAAVAQEEMARYGIPASITLAQGLLESNAGLSPLAANANNHFGIKCFSRRCYKGHCRNYSDDSHKDFFRVYANAWESFRAHSLFLQKPRYQALFRLGKRDYRGWARGLTQAGYATDPGYGDKLIRMIERFELHRYD